MAYTSDSTLNDIVKSYCGLDPDDASFDVVFESSVGSSMLKLKQIGGYFTPPESGPYLTLALKNLGLSSASDPVIAYLCLNARLAYDPPSSAQVMTALNDEIAQTEFRISIT